MATMPKDLQAVPSTVRYVEEDLAARDVQAEEDALDAYIERNKDSLNISIAKAKAQYERKEYFTFEQVKADIDAQRLRRRDVKG